MRRRPAQLRLPGVPHALGIGFGFGLAALLMRVALDAWPRLLVLPYVIALAATAFCGLYVLLATWRDSYRNPRRGARIRPIRGFDLAAGTVLLVPAAWGLYPFLPAL